MTGVSGRDLLVCEWHHDMRWPDQCDCGAGMRLTQALRDAVAKEMSEFTAKKYGPLLILAAAALEAVPSAGVDDAMVTVPRAVIAPFLRFAELFDGETKPFQNVTRSDADGDKDLMLSDLWNLRTACLTAALKATP